MGHCCCSHCHQPSESDGKKDKKPGLFKLYRPELTSLVMLIAGIIFFASDLAASMASKLFGVAFVWYLLAVLPVGKSILKETWELWRKGDFFNEFTLMTLSFVGAFIIGEYPEGVAVLLFYSFGEKLEGSASEKARARIRALIGKLPRQANVRQADGSFKAVEPAAVAVGSVIAVKPGERVPLDGVLLNPEANLDLSAITGESLPIAMKKDAEVVSGAIPVDSEVLIQTTRPYSESTMSRIMKMIEEAGDSKSKSETLLRKVTRWYTPAVTIAAALLFVVPMLIAQINGVEFDWRLWLERSLVLLVCSCPCAFIVSVPLSYFAALGNASRKGVLFKGAKSLDAIRGIDTLLLDKTGTLTTGEFSVKDIIGLNGESADRVLAIAAAIDKQSVHPLAQAICKEAEKQGVSIPEAEDVKTVTHGMTGVIDGAKITVGSPSLGNITLPDEVKESTGSIVCITVDGKLIGVITLGDTLKDGVAATIARLRSLGVKNVVILSGDAENSVATVARQIGADQWHSRLLPSDKQEILAKLKAEGRRTAFVGDGINDAPSLALADVGIAIGNGGTDLAMETADAVLTGKGLERLADAMSLSKRIKRIVAQNITLALGTKLTVMILGALGIATLWAAVFADTGITLITVIWTLIALRK